MAVDVQDGMHIAWHEWMMDLGASTGAAPAEAPLSGCTMMGCRYLNQSSLQVLTWMERPWRRGGEEGWSLGEVL